MVISVKNLSRFGLTFGAIGFVVWLAYNQDWQALSAIWANLAWLLVIISFYRFVGLAVDSWAWMILLPDPATRPGFMTILKFRWIGESINNLLPVAQVGGDFVRAQLLGRWVRPTDAAAATIIDFALGLVTQAIFTLIGVVLVVLWGTEGEGAWVIGLLMIVLGLLAWWGLTRLPITSMVGILQKISGKDLESWGAAAGDFRQSMSQILAQRRMLFWACLLKLAAWNLRALEIWVILIFIADHTSINAAIAIESLSMAARSVAFLIPAGFGAQEGGVVAVAQIFGLSTSSAFTIALAKRAREWLVSLPGLIAWALTKKSHSH